MQPTTGDVIRAYRECFASEQGQLVLADLISRFGFNYSAMMPPDGNPSVFAHRDGSRSVLVHINNRIEQDPETADQIEETQSYG